MTASLKIKGLACDRGGRRLFANLSLELVTGQAALVTGANGAGKSSLLRVIAGLLPPSEGTIVSDGAIALADEHLALDRNLSLADALAFWARVDGRHDIDDALAAFGLTELAPVPVRFLSTGQRKRAVLARTWGSGAAIWLLDEPGNGLDQDALVALSTAVRRHLDKGGIAVVASHQPLDIGFRHEVTL